MFTKGNKPHVGFKFPRSSSLLVKPWRVSSHIALLSPKSSGDPPTVESIRHELEGIQSKGYSEVTTTAMTKSDASIYFEMGFDVREELLLLSTNIAPDSRRNRFGCISSASPIDTTAMLTIDRLCFDEFWMFDRQALLAAKRAAPANKSRVVRFGGGVAGYSITGKSGDAGYIQRLGVHPDFRRLGFGKALVLDSLSWLARKGATTALVNTQVSNKRAANLYQKLGFSPLQDGLVVLKWTA